MPNSSLRTRNSSRVFLYSLNRGRLIELWNALRSPNLSLRIASDSTRVAGALEHGNVSAAVVDLESADAHMVLGELCEKGWPGLRLFTIGSPGPHRAKLFEALEKCDVTHFPSPVDMELLRASVERKLREASFDRLRSV